MPRPKRTKLAPTAPTPRAQQSPTATSTPPSNKHTSLYNDTNLDSATSNLRTQDSPKAPREEAMRGVTEPQVQNARRRRIGPVLKKAVETEEQSRALENLRQRRDIALGKRAKDAEVEIVPSTAEQQDEPEEQEEVIREVRRITPDAVKYSESGARRRISSPKQTSPPESAMRVRKTPAIDSSVLALANFKRRPRQPSILRMVQQSAHRRAASSASEEASEELDDDMEPDDESTPLNVRVSTEQIQSDPDAAGTPSGAQNAGTSSSRKRKYVEDVEGGVQVPRSSPPVSVARDEGAAIGSPSQHSATSDEFASLPENVEVEATQDEQHQFPQDQAPQDEEEIYSATMAPPRSSSSPSLPSLHTRPQQASKQRARPKPTASKRRKRPRKGNRNDLDIENATDNGLSSSQEEDGAPPTTNKARNTTAKGADTFSPSLSTAHLQSLLPQRRRRAPRQQQQDAFDIPSSSSREDMVGIEINSEDDELLHPVSRRQRRQPKPSLTTTKTKQKKATPARSHKAKQTPKPKTKPTAASSTAKRYSRKTYTDAATAGTFSDKENHAHDHGSGDEEEAGGEGSHEHGGENGETTLLATPSAELRKAVEKFKEVDEWEMEFESVTVEGHRSSSPRWR